MPLPLTTAINLGTSRNFPAFSRESGALDWPSWGETSTPDASTHDHSRKSRSLYISSLPLHFATSVSGWFFLLTKLLEGGRGRVHNLTEETSSQTKQYLIPGSVLYWFLPVCSDHPTDSKSPSALIFGGVPPSYHSLHRKLHLHHTLNVINSQKNWSNFHTIASYHFDFILFCRLGRTFPYALSKPRWPEHWLTCKTAPPAMVIPVASL